MKKTITTLMTFGLLMLSTGVMAQQYDVPGTYATIQAAFTAINADITTDPTITAVTINVAEGTVVELAATEGVIHPSVMVTIKGAGADKTFIESFRADRIVPGEADALGTHFINLTNVASDNVEYTIQDLTLRYFGRGDNENGGVFASSTTKAWNNKITITNVVFDRVGAKQGAVLHGANGTHELMMDNCLIIGCVTYGGSAFGGPITVDNGGVITITNCTFINNIMNPWDHRSAANPIDVGAGRGGVIKLKDGVNSGVYSPLIFTMENCAFVNNLVDNNATTVFPAVSDSIHPVMNISVTDTALCELTIVDNIFIGNRRAGYELTDVDVVINVPWEKVMLTADGNIMNSMVSAGGYMDIIIDGFIANRDFTYTHPLIQFNMDGDLPALIPDAEGIGHVEYAGTGVSVDKLHAIDVALYPNPSNGLFNLRLPDRMKNSTYEVYSITGRLVRSGVFYNRQATLDLTNTSKGMYLLRIKNGSETNTRRIIVK
ncbi:MAG: T9SS type A sorting domain-containing protein [Bacteroidales bacterium]|jgi:hypothetical protein|nr:T9SS type A sorting domain-containing protein [Bacteroidales bacterium]